jgi:hypothetical protein
MYLAFVFLSKDSIFQGCLRDVDKGEGGALQYLEERFPDKRPLLPKDLVKRAQIHQVLRFPALLF